MLKTISQRVTEVSAGGKHSLILLHSGIVYGAGCNENSELGPNFARITTTFKEISSLSHIPGRKIAAGYGHSALISVSHQLYIWGSSVLSGDY